MMTNDWVLTRRLLKFLVWLDVVEYDEIQTYLGEHNPRWVNEPYGRK